MTARLFCRLIYNFDAVGRQKGPCSLWFAAFKKDDQHLRWIGCQLFDYQEAVADNFLGKGIEVPPFDVDHVPSRIEHSIAKDQTVFDLR